MYKSRYKDLTDLMQINEVATTEYKVSISLKVKIESAFVEKPYAPLLQLMHAIASCLGPGGGGYVDVLDSSGNHCFSIENSPGRLIGKPDSPRVSHQILSVLLKDRYQDRYLFHKVTEAKFNRRKDERIGTLNLEAILYLK